jgi:hypothetical protein
VKRKRTKETAKKPYRNLRMLLVVASASVRELRIPLNFLLPKMLYGI